ncbi:hypothetical protein JKP88DRAFT_352254 [Tribonema minus]|uniref:Uncharacterized protein n=1 Tax=Tribonema minus TaxID=303371 RepID=A0A835ZET9_9STRA|nr:hypothetical protein JKP88DRAFT_352254 [Tribonema minus]
MLSRQQRYRRLRHNNRPRSGASPDYSDDTGYLINDRAYTTPSPTSTEADGSSHPSDTALLQGLVLTFVAVATVSGAVATMLGLCTRDCCGRRGGYTSLDGRGNAIRRAPLRIRAVSASALLVLNKKGVLQESRLRSFGSAPNLSAILEVADSDMDDEEAVIETGDGA